MRVASGLAQGAEPRLEHGLDRVLNPHEIRHAAVAGVGQGLDELVPRRRGRLGSGLVGCLPAGRNRFRCAGWPPLYAPVTVGGTGQAQTQSAVGVSRRTAWQAIWLVGRLAQGLDLVDGCGRGAGRGEVDKVEQPVVAGFLEPILLALQLGSPAELGLAAERGGVKVAHDFPQLRDRWRRSC